MSLWSWLFEKIAQPSKTAPREAVASPHQDSPTSAVAVGVDADPDPRTPAADAPWWVEKEGTLLEPVPAQKPQDSHPLGLFEDILVSHFDGHDLSMPVLNNVAEKILPKLHSKQCDLKSVARELAADQVLSAAVLRTVNSPMYRGLGKITSVPAAVTRIGMTALRTILLHQSVRSAIFGKHGSMRQFANQVWRRSLTDAHIMADLARLLQQDQDECRLIGLMHDIGSVLVLRILNEHVKTMPLDLDSFEYLRRQTHQEFGELIAQAWHLPPELSDLITNHHSCPKPDDPLATQRFMLVLTEMIAEMLSVPNGERYDLIRCRPAVVLGLSGRDAYRSWLTQLPEEIQNMLDDSEAQ